MAISHSVIGKGIVSGIISGTTASFPTTPYLALYTTLPGADGTGGEETNYPEYSRVKINVNGIEGKNIMAAPTSEAGTGDDEGKTISLSKNQEIIYFPEAETGAGGTVVGWGLYSTLTGGSPYLWGELKEAAEIPQNSVPMFRINDFLVRVK